MLPDVALLMPTVLVRAVHLFWELVDSESVRAFVWPYYIAFLTWGIYGTFFAAPVTIVHPVMGPLIYNVWIWSCIFGPLAVMIGLILGPIAARTKCWTREDGIYAGLWMQVLGNFGVGIVLFAYEFAGIRGAYWGLAAFSLFILPPYILGCLTLTLQAARKLWKIEQIARGLK